MLYVFLLRDVMRKRGLCCRLVAVCLSLRLFLSIMFVYCIQTAEDIKFLSLPGSPIIPVF